MRRSRILVWGLVFLGIASQSTYAKTAYAYVVNSGGNSVSVINTNTNAVVATVSVGTSPFAVAVNAAATLAYVTNTASNTVSIISTSTNTVTASIPVCAGPTDIALSPTGSTAYVSCPSANMVALVNTATKKVTANISVQHPAALGVVPNGTYLYVASSTTGKVLAISTLSNTIAATITVGTTPVGLAITPDGSTAYVTNSGSHTVTVIQTSNNAVSNTINVSAGPDRDAVSPDGHWVYVSNYNGGAGNILTVIDTGTQTVAGTIVVGIGPRGIAFGEDGGGGGVANEGSGTVTLFDTASRTVTGTITVGSAPTGGAVMGIVHVSTVAGGYVGDKGLATSAALQSPSATVLDSAGNLYITDVTANRIRKVTSTGTITTYAGNGICGFNGDGVVASKALLCSPTGLTLDPAGNLVFAEQGTNRVRSISKTTGKITTIAGNGAYGNTGDHGLATSAETGQPFWPVYDSAGNLYFTMVSLCVVRKVNTSGIISTVAGNGTCGFGGDGGAATAAMLKFPRGIAFDASGNLYIADTSNHRIRRVDTSGKITTFAGTGKAGFSGDGGLATSAMIGNPRAVTVQGSALYITNAGSSRYRWVNLATNIINTYAGSTFGYDGDNHALLATQFAGGGSIGFDSSSNPIFADINNARVRKATAGIVSTIAGGYIGDGGKATAALVLPEAVYVDKTGIIFVADYTGNRVRKISGGTISTIVGTGVSGYTGDNGPGTLATLYGPQGVAKDSAGNIFISDAGNGVIRKITASGTISTFAANANFSDVYKIAVDSANNLYVADDLSCVVWKITPAAVVSIAAGVLKTCGYNGDNIAATSAQLNLPYGVAVDSSGNLLIADFANSRVREVNTSGIISTVAGTGTCGYTGDGGSPTSAELCPNGIAVDSSNIYIADNFTRIRRIKHGSGAITTFAGSGFGFNGDGLWPLLTGMDSVVDVVVDSKGAVYELDDWDHRVRKIQ